MVKKAKASPKPSPASLKTTIRNKEQRLLQQNLAWQKVWQRKLQRTPQAVFEYNRFGHLVFAFVVGAAGIYYAFTSFASPVNPSRNTPVVNLSIEPSARRLSKGQTLSLRVWADSLDQSVSVVDARLDFPPDLFEFVAADTSTSDFAQGTVDATAAPAGHIALSQAATHGLTGRQFVAEVTFRAKAATGSGAISFSKDSALLRASDKANILQRTSAGRYDISVEDL